MFKIDHHLHTTRYSPDSLIDPEDLIRWAMIAGLDAVVITEHDVQWPEDELAEINAQAGGDLVILSGAEVSAREGHFLVYGLPDLGEAPPGVRLADLIKAVRRYNGAIVAAHPFRWGQDFDAIVEEHGPVFDALEVVSNNVDPNTRRKTEELLRRNPGMGATGSSDGHEAHVLGCYFTAFSRPIRSMPDFVAALLRREGRPGHRAGIRLSAGPVGT